MSSIYNIKANFIYFSREFLAHSTYIAYTNRYHALLCARHCFGHEEDPRGCSCGEEADQPRSPHWARRRGRWGLWSGRRLVREGPALMFHPTSLTLTWHVCPLSSWSLFLVLGLFFLPVTLVNDEATSGGVDVSPPTKATARGGSPAPCAQANRRCEKQHGGRDWQTGGWAGEGKVCQGGCPGAGPMAAASVRSLFLPVPGAGLLLLPDAGGQQPLPSETLTGSAFHALALFLAPGRQWPAAQGTDGASS